MRRLFLLCSVLFLALCATHAQELRQFTGTWKEDLGRSQDRPSTALRLNFSTDQNGVITETRGSGSTKITLRFRIDGKDYPVPLIPDRTVSWREVDHNTWETTMNRGGQVISTSRQQLSEDGNRFTVTSRLKMQSGAEDAVSMVYERVSGERSGLTGEWKPVSEKRSRPAVIKLEAADGAVRFSDVDSGVGYDARLDGKDYPYSGPNVLPNLTVSIQSEDGHSIREAFNRDGKAIYETVLTLSVDGRRLSVSGKPPGSGEEPSTRVYLRQ